jgi:hypothetical protein
MRRKWRHWRGPQGMRNPGRQVQVEALTHTMTWRDLEHTLLSERSRYKRPHSV